MGIEQNHQILLTRTGANRWHVRINGFDTGLSYQYPWNALECALNGSLTGRPITDIQNIEVNATGESSQNFTDGQSQAKDVTGTALAKLFL